MVPIPDEYLPNFWDDLSADRTTIELSCLLPNGIIVLLNVNINDTLDEIKQDLWEEARNYPLCGKLQTDRSLYLFKIINSMAEEEELNDGTRKLADIRPMGGVLIISECRLNSVDHSINLTIGHLIGKGLQDFDAINNPEINDFRFNMKCMGEKFARNRSEATWQEKLLYQFPPRICQPASTSMLLINLRNITYLRVEAKCEYEYNMVTEPENNGNQDILQSSFQFNVSPHIRPMELLEKILKKAGRLKFSNEKITEYALKVCGRDEYLLGDHPLIQFQYVQDCISDRITPSLLTVHINRIPVVHSDYEYAETLLQHTPLKQQLSTTAAPSTSTSSTSSSNTLMRKKKSHQMMQSWNVNVNYAITVSVASKVNCDARKTSEIGIQVGVFHGGKPLCQPVKTGEKPILGGDDAVVNFDTALEFDIQVANIPRNAKLCFVIYELAAQKASSKTRNAQPKMNPIAWANTSIYDFRGQLKIGAMTLYMWTYAEDLMSDDVLHPLGTVVSNPNVEYSTALTVICHNYYPNDTIIVYPSKCHMSAVTTTPSTSALLEHDDDIDDSNSLLQHCERLIQEIDSVDDAHDQDRKHFWRFRHVWMRTQPELLPKLLHCIDWDKHVEIAQVYALLEQWPPLPVEKALELLDYAYPDQEVRSFAVKCLYDVSDDDLQLYLLQLVQAIKHELYLECHLVQFLLERALCNQRIGHFLFWHLRSEMQIPAVSVRFGLILEAYCRGCQEHLTVLQRQLKSVEKLKKCCEIVRSRRDKEKAKHAMKEYLTMTDDKEMTVRSPLDPSYRCRRIRVGDCRVMDSKMRPLWIVYENSDQYGEDVYVIFKNGDDLRQDMLTLQMLKVMDRLWKQEGLDLRMNAYNCISLEHRVGMIQVVLNAETIANIQKEKSSAVVANFKKGSILAWLKDYNQTEKALSKAIEEFTMSCAGYCVATYILGIADRHPDNIMIKKSGQLFHIDFGHILGHFKEKFGIKRERVPFVLTHDFVNVINKGQKGGEQSTNALEFMLFQEYCEKAFMILRKHGNLILSLFAMMISTGLPELTSEKDLQYLRETLVLSKSDDEALEHFKAKFNEALSNSWTTSVNWASHNISKNNKA